MRFTVKWLFFACLIIFSTVKIFLMFIFLTSNDNPGPTLEQLAQLPKYLRELYKHYVVKGAADIDDDNWRDWDRNRLKNDELFFYSFQTTSKPSLQQCKLRKPKVVLCVFSLPSSRTTRMAVRRTWGNASLVPMENVTLWFVVGRSPNNGTDEDGRITDESTAFGDVILGNFTDTPESETIKMLFSLYFVITSCPSAVDVYFGFDKTYVNVQRLLTRLTFQSAYGGGHWRGFVRKGMKPQRDKQNPFYISREDFKNDIYPEFCTLHNGFTLSASSGKELLNIARNESLIKFADVYFGMLARKARLKIAFDQSFGSQALLPNINLCEVRYKMLSFTYIGDSENQWKELVNVDKLRKCLVPDVDIAFPKSNNNKPYFQKVLKYLHNNESLCSNVNGNIFIISLISSHAKNFEQRQAIRDTWASQYFFYGRNVRNVFILGKAGGPSEDVIQQQVDAEVENYGDVVQGNFYESFKNLTLKVVLGLKWTAECCPQAAYLYKGDEDMFVAWHNLVKFLLDTSDQAGKEVMSHFFVGNKMRGSRRISDPRSRYYVNESLYKASYFPLYCSGGSYVLSTDMVPELFKRSLLTPLIPIDDAYQGALTEQIGVHPIHYQGFKVGFNRKSCTLQDSDTLTLHGFKSPISLRNVWRKYRNKEKCLS